MEPKRLEVETTFINTWVEHGTFALVVSGHMSAELRRLAVDLVDVNYVLKTGIVVRSDMLENRGLWDVLGRTVDGVGLVVQVAVVSAECEVELLRLVQLKRRTG